ncbi:MAG: ZIP family metal transporter [Candidatus Omnitrophota bacterium]|nr:ZIP family metal transporter [Candidatus Omnitrophota bacterium]
MILIWILVSTFIVSAISLIGIITFAVKDKILEKILFLLVGFSAGALIGGAFLHLIPEALEQGNPQQVFFYIILGFTLFFLLEKYLHWRHCHDEICEIHPFTYLNLIGDGFHNFLDGMVIAASFLVSIKLGLVTTVAVILHEIPQELGDFAVLIYGGFTKTKALLFNLLSALTAVVGAVVGYFISSATTNFSSFILPLTAGGFIYIASSDLIPELHKEKDTRKSISAFLCFILGIIFMWLAKKLHL